VKIDINGDGAENYSDILSWTAEGGFYDHLNINQNKIPNYIGSTERLDRSYSAIFSLNPPLFSGGFRKEVGDALDLQVSNLPEGMTYKYYLAGEDYTNESLIFDRSGNYSFTFNVLDEEEVIYQFSKEVIVSSQSVVKETELSSIDVADQQIVVEPSDSLSLSGTAVHVKQASVSSQIALTIAEQEVSTIANTESVAISPVISLGPEGTTFTEPVQVKIPFNTDGIDPENTESLQIIRKSGDQIDYLSPNSIDYSNGFAYFETDHFSLFGLFSRKTGFAALSISEKSNFITKIDDAFDLGFRPDAEWEAILDYEYTEGSITLFEYIEAYFHSELLFNADQEGGVGAALDIAFPNGSALDNSVENWNQALKGLEKFESFYTSAISQVGQGEKFFNLLELLIDASEVYDATTQTNDILYSPFAPVKMGDQLFQEFHSILQDRRLAILDISAEQGCDFVTVEEVGSEEGYQNFQYVCRLVENFAQQKEEQIANISDLLTDIEKELEILENANFPYLTVKVDSINNVSVTEQTVTQTRTISSSDPLSVKLNITGYGIRDFDRDNLQIDLISLENESIQLRGNWSQSSQIATFDMGSLSGRHQFKIEVRDTVSDVSFEYHLVNVNIIEALEIVSVSNLGGGNIYHGQTLKVEFNEPVTSESLREAVVYFGDRAFEHNDGWFFALDNQLSIFEGGAAGRVAEFRFSFEEYGEYELYLLPVESEQGDLRSLEGSDESIFFDYGVDEGRDVFVYDVLVNRFPDAGEVRIYLNGYLAKGLDYSLVASVEGGGVFEFDLGEAIAHNLANPGAPSSATISPGRVGVDYNLVVNEWNQYDVIDVALYVVNLTGSAYSGEVDISLCASTNACFNQSVTMSLNARD